jgi:hypothetical protein
MTPLYCVIDERGSPALETVAYTSAEARRLFVKQHAKTWQR